MRATLADITLRNPLRSDIHPVVVRAQLEMSTMVLRLPEDIAAKLKLENVGTRDLAFADGTKKSVPYVGPIQTTFENRSSFCGAMVMGNIVLLGAIAMEDMDLVISPKLQRVEVNPDSPNVPSAVVM